MLSLPKPFHRGSCSSTLASPPPPPPAPRGSFSTVAGSVCPMCACVCVCVASCPGPVWTPTEAAGVAGTQHGAGRRAQGHHRRQCPRPVPSQLQAAHGDRLPQQAAGVAQENQGDTKGENRCGHRMGMVVRQPLHRSAWPKMGISVGNTVLA